MANLRRRQQAKYRLAAWQAYGITSPPPSVFSNEAAVFSRTSLRRPVMYTGCKVSPFLHKKTRVDRRTLGTIGRKTLRDHPSDACASTGDERDAAFEVVEVL